MSLLPPNISRAMLRNAAVLAAFAATTTAAVALLVWWTSPRVDANQLAARIAAINEVMPASQYNNDLLKDKRKYTDERLGDPQKPRTVYIARKDGTPAGAVLDILAPEGYGGAIHLLIGVDANGTLLGVRMVPPHPETPGLGDQVDVKKSPWIRGFAGKSLQQPDEPHWGVKKDGGDFDQFTGATITPRAVVKAVRDSLRWYRDHRDQLFAINGDTP